MSIIIPKPITGELTSLIDDDAGVTYIGRAKLGSAPEAAAWQIMRISTSGTVIQFQYANSSRRFNQVWNDRTGLTYAN